MRQSAQQCPLCRMLLTRFHFGDERDSIEETGVGFVTIFQGQELNLIVYYFGQLGDGGWEFLETSASLNFERLSEEQKGSLQNSKGSPSVALQAWTVPVINDSLQRIKGWLASQSPSVSLTKEFPTRLLRLEPGAVFPSVRLVNIKDGNISHAPYATLSHCWGGHQPICLKTGSFSSFTQQIPFESLPRTFGDAVEATLALGLSWLWIDSLCIIQDSEDDWLRESEQMDTVYSQAYVNLAATSSRNSSGGLFPKSGVLKQSCILQTTWTGIESGTIMVYDENSFIREVATSPLNNRGWVFQERVLAPRTIHFTHHQIWWTTNDSLDVYVDSFPTSIQHLLADVQWESRKEAMLPPVLWRVPDETNYSGAWRMYVRGYSKTALTKPSDKLIALAGIAKMFANVYGLQETDYLAGLWRQNLVRELLWAIFIRHSGSRPDLYRAPSWSWASTDGEVWDPSSEELTSETTILQANVCTVNGSFGPVKHGFIVLKGPLVPVELCYHAEGSDAGGIDIFQTVTIHNNSKTTLLGALDVHTDFKQSNRGRFYIGVFHEGKRSGILRCGLLLRRTIERGEFTRVGFVNLNSVISEAWEESISVGHSMLDESESLQYDAESGFHTYRIV
ncbi:HET-domain-containing protein [Amniculicola lignicola CBS 123094]|uniref:HET-domain-containing protein n=1 Tax=Amniculicola lignicola CBS 123094 TaxID=1392246 RepID=A0A6A5WKC1_9PLEO|nr:HET-domain-containing protein [Amniculicola lignicola CBS 123094]